MICCANCCAGGSGCWAEAVVAAPTITITAIAARHAHANLIFIGPPFTFEIVVSKGCAACRSKREPVYRIAGRKELEVLCDGAIEMDVAAIDVEVLAGGVRGFF